MNFDFLKTLDAFDNATSSRRDALRKAGRLGANAALAALPFYASAKQTMANNYGFNLESDLEILNYALTLEYLEYYFYLQAVGNADLDPGDDPEFVIIPAQAEIPPDLQEFFQGVRDNEKAHVDFLTSTIEDLEGTPVVYEIDDFTYEVNGTSVFSDYEGLFLTLAQGFEDAGVRAYKGQAASIESPIVLTAALQIHSVEARHAAAIRRLRGNKGWIPFDQPDADPAIAAIYQAGTPASDFPAEDNTTQGGVELVGALAGLGYTDEQITAAFDEPIDDETVFNENGTGIINPFVTP